MLSINLSELIWTIINFFLLYFLLKRFLYTPLTRFLDARQAKIDDALAQENAAKAALEESRGRIESEKSARREEAAALRAGSEAEDETQSRLALAKAESDAEAALSDAQKRIETERRDESAAIAAETDALADALAQRLLGGKP